MVSPDLVFVMYTIGSCCKYSATTRRKKSSAGRYNAIFFLQFSQNRKSPASIEGKIKQFTTMFAFISPVGVDQKSISSFLKKRT